MLEIDPVELDITLPDGPVGMVLMQPYIRLAKPLREPYRWDPSATRQQIAAIGRTLEIATNPARVGGYPVFTVFPEYAIPGLEGVHTIDQAIQREGWSEKSVVIGGVDGLCKRQYTELVNGPNTIVHDSNSPDRMRDDEWANCCITWARDSAGTICRWVQPKIRPAWPELNTSYNSMFRGAAVFVFTVTYGGQRYLCRFATLLCFDWVARDGDRTAWHEVVIGLKQHWGQSTNFLHWMFVPQYNPDPNHYSFLDSTYEFLTTTADSSVDRRDAAVIMANVAAQPAPCRRGDGGCSAVIFGPQAPFDCNGCWPTVCTVPVKLRGANKLARLKDSVFREMGPCVHSFSIRVPRFVNPDATDRHAPVEDAQVHCLDDSVDSRTPNGPVPSVLKWVNDELDDVTCYANQVPPASESAYELTKDRHGLCLDEYRRLDAPTLQCRMAYSAASRTEPAAPPNMLNTWNPDRWANDESEALIHQIHTLSLLGAACDVTIAGATLHGTLMNGGTPVEIVAIRGGTHAEVLAHAETQLPGVNHRTIIIGRDSENSHTSPRELRRFTHIDESEDRDAINFTDPLGSRRVCDFASCRDAWQSAPDVATMRESICGVLGLR